MSDIPGKKQSLVEAYKAALSQWPAGHFYASDHDHDDIKVFERMADVIRSYDPDDITATCVKASILILPQGSYHRSDGCPEKRFAEAAKLLRPIIEAGENNKNLISDFAHSLYYTGEYTEAVPHLRALREFYPGDNYNAMMLCYALFKAGQKAEALQLFQPLIDQFPDLMPSFNDEITEMIKAGHQVISKLVPTPGN